jgi:hypothetical protein
MPVAHHLPPERFSPNVVRSGASPFPQEGIGLGVVTGANRDQAPEAACGGDRGRGRIRGGGSRAPGCDDESDPDDQSCSETGPGTLEGRKRCAGSGTQ